MKSVLFVCIHNAARSQMAEAFTRQYGGHKYQAFSAGIEPGQLNPLVVAAMAEVGIDISGQPCRTVAQHLQEQGEPDIVITVCDQASAERCPGFGLGVERLHWAFEDPSSLTGDVQDKLHNTRRIRDQIKQCIECWCATQ